MSQSVPYSHSFHDELARWRPEPEEAAAEEGETSLVAVPAAAAAVTPAEVSSLGGAALSARTASTPCC